MPALLIDSLKESVFKYFQDVWESSVCSVFHVAPSIFKPANVPWDFLLLGLSLTSSSALSQEKARLLRIHAIELAAWIIRNNLPKIVINNLNYILKSPMSCKTTVPILFGTRD